MGVEFLGQFLRNLKLSGEKAYDCISSGKVFQTPKMMHENRDTIHSYLARLLSLNAGVQPARFILKKITKLLP